MRSRSVATAKLHAARHATPPPPRRLAALLLIAAAAAFPACGTSGHDRPAVEVTATPVDGRQHVEIALHSFYFEPNRITVKAGVPVELRLSKKSFFVPHNFHLSAPEAGIEVNQNVGFLGVFPGGKTVTFTPTKPGEYEFMCHKGNHMAKGMMGTLIVVE